MRRKCSVLLLRNCLLGITTPTDTPQPQYQETPLYCRATDWRPRLLTLLGLQSRFGDNWGQTTRNLSGLPPKRGCGSIRVIRDPLVDSSVSFFRSYKDLLSSSVDYFVTVVFHIFLTAQPTSQPYYQLLIAESTTTNSTDSQHADAQFEPTLACWGAVCAGPDWSLSSLSPTPTATSQKKKQTESSARMHFIEGNNSRQHTKSFVRTIATNRK